MWGKISSPWRYSDTGTGAQRGCGISILRGNQNLTGTRHWATWSTWTCSEQKLRWADLHVSLLTCASCGSIPCAPVICSSPNKKGKVAFHFPQKSMLCFSSFLDFISFMVSKILLGKGFSFLNCVLAVLQSRNNYILLWEKMIPISMQRSKRSTITSELCDG